VSGRDVNVLNVGKSSTLKARVDVEHHNNDMTNIHNVLRFRLNMWCQYHMWFLLV